MHVDITCIIVFCKSKRTNCYNKNMIKNRLSIILGEQRMRVSELSKLSGISQNALNKIYHGKTKGIDFQTLDKLCDALRCTTQDLFQYIEK